MSESTEPAQPAPSTPPANGLRSGPIDAVFRLVMLLVLLYIFLVAINLIGSSFQLIGGGAAGSLFQGIDNPILALMIGMLATATLQSSSTTTAITVGLVAGGAVDMVTAIPMIMGANIGTSVTNTFVSMGHASNREEFKRAFAGATVHDFFNFLAVIIMLPLEMAFGLLQKASFALTEVLAGTGGASLESPLKAIIKPAAKLFVSIDKGKIKSAAMGQDFDGSLIKGGLLEGLGMSDRMAGFLLLGIAAAMLVLALLRIVKLMKSMMEAKAATWLKIALEKNAYVSMFIGAGATVAVQSSSITTSTLVPMVGVGLITLEAVFPLTLGANVGTTVTAMLASMGATGEGAVLGLQIALCHLLFNLVGILIWYPIPAMRRVPLGMARWLGEKVAVQRKIAFIYVAVVFFLIPLTALGIMEALK